MLGGAGWPEYYDLAERYTRGMLLPTQHREQELRGILHDKANPADDSERDTVRRSVGGYAMQLPNARMRTGDWPISTLDISSGAVHALSEFYRQRTMMKDGIYTMNLQFDFEDNALTLDSELPRTDASRFAPNRTWPAFASAFRPGWTRARSTSPSAEPRHRQPWTASMRRSLRFPLDHRRTRLRRPCRVEKETVDGTVYTTTWMGNQIVDIKPRGEESPLPF